MHSCNVKTQICVTRPHFLRRTTPKRHVLYEIRGICSRNARMRFPKVRYFKKPIRLTTRPGISLRMKMCHHREGNSALYFEVRYSEGRHSVGVDTKMEESNSILHHDNAPPHTSPSTGSNFGEEPKSRPTFQQLYSPDLTHCDFRCFSRR